MKKFILSLLLLILSTTSYAAGIDNNTTLMMHMDGADASTSFIDSDPTPKTITPYGNAQIDTAQAKFDQSGLFDGNADGFTVADSPDFAFGSGNATIDLRIRFSSIAGSSMLYQHTDGSTAVYWQWYQPNSTLNFQIYSGGALTTFLAPTWSPVANTWYHLALVKNGSDYAVYVDGVKLSNVTGGSWPDAAAALRVGSNSDGSRAHNGWIDEYRISKSARWTANFTPDTVAYSAPPPPAAPVVGLAENEYWKDRAAMLDPNAYEYHSGVFSVTNTVPTYLLNGWQLTSGGDATRFWYHRKADIANALLITAGTSVQHVGSPSGQNYNFDWGYALLAKPSLVTSDPRYNEPRDLWYSRLEKLKTLPLRSLKVKITQTHTPIQAQNAGTNVASFPTDFENGLLVHFSTMDGSWIVLESDTNVTTPLSPSYRILNLSDELDDARSVRFSGAVLIPFKRSQFPTMRIGFGTVFPQACTGINAPVSGCQGPNHPINSVYPTSQTYPAYGQVLYYNLDELPEPW